MYHLKRISTDETIAEYPCLDVACDRLRARFQVGGVMVPEYDPADWIIEEWRDDAPVTNWRVARDFEVFEVPVIPPRWENPILREVLL